LKVEDVLEIRAMFDAGVPRREIQEKFDINSGSVYFIGKRIQWKSVPEATSKRSALS
jgi:hypothetical protein